MKLYNTPAKLKQDFLPINPESVKLYTCGPTVYDKLHIGNWSAYIYWDILVRTLLANGYKVDRVLNITDVGHLVSDGDDGEDKLQKSAYEKGKSAWDIAKYYTEEFISDFKKLNLIEPEHIVKATDYINQQIELIKQLKSKGFTYQTDDGIYFDISKFPNYPNFAHLVLDEEVQSRIAHISMKKHPQDFALWKFSPTDQKRDMEWLTPADLIDDGKDRMGFPGWHIECSAIALSILGETIDIHTGGIDHIPVHHTNEIAQSESATGKKFSNFWLHNNHLKINGTKISKSLNNGITLDQLLENGYSANDIKLFVLQGNYHNEGNFTEENMSSAKNRIHNWMNYAALRHQTHDTIYSDKEIANKEQTIKLPNLQSELLNHLNEDLNTPEAMKAIDDYFSELDDAKLSSIDNNVLTKDLEVINELLGIDLMTTTPDIGDELKEIIIKRQRAREENDWKLSDELRDQLLEENIVINDTPSGPIWSFKS